MGQHLTVVAFLYTMQDPCVIAGFDMDRLGTIAALAKEPAGTFICRLSLSQPGCLVLTCKVQRDHPMADKNNLLHAIINVSGWLWSWKLGN